MEIFFQGGVFEDSIFPEFKISSLLFQKTVRTIGLSKPQKIFLYFTGWTD
jgi:hypothetical protein